MEPIVISVKRKPRKSEKLLRGLMIGLTVLFLLGGILLFSGLMLPCFLTAMAYFVYAYASRREWEYTLQEDMLRIERVSDRGRFLLHEIRLQDVELLCPPDAEEAMPYKKNGTIRVPKYDYTSYEENVPYYTMIATEDQQRIKLLLDLTPEAIRWIRHSVPQAVKSI